jgi:hypothetical protein
MSSQWYDDEFSMRRLLKLPHETTGPHERLTFESFYLTGHISFLIQQKSGYYRMRALRPVRDSHSEAASHWPYYSSTPRKRRKPPQRDTDTIEIPVGGGCCLIGEQLSLLDNVANIATVVFKMLSAVQKSLIQEMGIIVETSRKGRNDGGCG